MCVACQQKIFLVVCQVCSNLINMHECIDFLRVFSQVCACSTVHLKDYSHHEREHI